MSIRFTGAEPWLTIPSDKLTWADLPQDFAGRSKAIIILALRELEYEDYLQTEHWWFIRRRTLRMQRFVCLLCPERARDVHHFNYNRRGFEWPEDVKALCRPCHTRFHETWRAQAKAGLEAAR